MMATFSKNSKAKVSSVVFVLDDKEVNKEVNK